MSDSMSTASYGISSVPYVSSTNLNPLKSIHSSVISKIKKEIDLYNGVTTKCKSIWQALQKNDIAGSRLSEKVIEMVFKQFQNDLYNYTRISSLKDFMRLFDTDRDGFLNQDEQIRIFSYIKARVQLAANNALMIQAYVGFKALMKEVRQLESQIAKWQNDMRLSAHNVQLDKHQEIGQQRIDQFCLRYDQQFNDLMAVKLQRRQALEKDNMYELNLLEQRLSDPTEYMKIKPMNKVKYYQMQEKLVALEERVEQALDFRKQLNELEIKQKDRVDKLVEVKADNQKCNLRKRHEKARKQLQIKLDQMENRLTIRMSREYDILLKKNHLHQNEIKRLQTIMAKWATKKGTFYPELKRTKNLQKRRNQIIGQHKQVLRKASSAVLLEGEESVNPRITPKVLLQQTANFSISKKASEDLPVNSTCLVVNRNDNKIGRYLVSQKSLSEISLCKLYDENLQNLYQEAPAQNQLIYKAEVARKRKFIISKIL